MREEVIRAAPSARNQHVSAAIMQPVARQLDRIKRRRTGCINSKRTRAKTERTRCEMRRQTGREPVARVWPRDSGAFRRAPAGEVGSLRVEPHTLGVARHRRSWKRESTENQPRSWRRPLVSDRTQRFARAVQNPLKQWIQFANLIDGKQKPGCVEHRVETVYVATDVRPRSVRGVFDRAHRSGTRESPAVRRRL